jgi:hypothetical protein
MDVHIDNIRTEIRITDGVGTLSPEDVRKIVALVTEHLEAQQRDHEQRKADVSIRDRSFDKRGL